MKKYALEFLSIFIAVIAAFTLNNWNDNRRDYKAESRILSEIQNGLEKDMKDVQLNVMGHKQGIAASEYWRRIILGEEKDLDSLRQIYFVLTRDFVSIQNTSGYETLKSKGLELIQNDSLRTQIISLYEYDYKILVKLEEGYSELQFHENIFPEINKIIAPQFQYNVNGDIGGIELPLNISESEKKILLSHLWQLRSNRKFILQFYDEVEDKINKLSVEIKKELAH